MHSRHVRIKRDTDRGGIVLPIPGVPLVGDSSIKPEKIARNAL